MGGPSISSPAPGTKNLSNIQHPCRPQGWNNPWLTTGRALADSWVSLVGPTLAWTLASPAQGGCKPWLAGHWSGLSWVLVHPGRSSPWLDHGQSSTKLVQPLAGHLSGLVWVLADPGRASPWLDLGQWPRLVQALAGRCRPLVGSWQVLLDPSIAWALANFWLVFRVFWMMLGDFVIVFCHFSMSSVEFK